ncbi:hypothetical protein RI129_011574 [Pyrocoelia pectoralis]|uniref:PDZ domain-containing protein n=1 Tax=Pyrocoelia pectoralis TaxID=417401 RepID=A0AAN7ZDD3_9COLE
MEFIILKVNGTDISSFSYEDAVNAFLSAREPIVVEVKRRECESSGCDTACLSKCMSTAVQTDLSGLNRLEETSFEYLSNDIDFEEVTLRKCNGNEKLGLTVCYSSGSDVDTYTEVYIQNIAPNSVAHCDGRLRQGDQILQVNGKDVTNKDETESLFAENPKAVTLLVSRCINQNDKETEFPIECLTSSSRSVAYQNSLIEQLVQQQSGFQQPTRDVPTVPPHLQLNLTNSLIRSQMYMINHEIAELDKRMQNIQLVNRDKFQTVSESDSEHIYETIPESLDSTLEPIYSCPYESQENINLQLFVTDKQDTSQIPKEEKTKQTKNVQTNSFQKNSNEEEHDNSSSAYNTGGSCNSNLLTVELSYGLNSNQRDNYRSTLVLYAPSEEEKSKKLQESNDNCDLCEAVTLKPNKNKAFTSKICNAPTTTSATKPDLNITDFLSDTMYTNVANLQQTILLQQQLFRQALGKQSNGTTCKPTTSFTTPSLSQYQFVNCQQVNIST